MANILFRTKGNANPKGKPRVYFTCHPADFEKCFDKVCEDIFKTHDCAIYYTEDMTAPIPADDLATDLGSNNLFVIPVTFKLLSQPNRAMDTDFAYAKSEHIPVLPFLMEPGIDMIYSRPDKFGKLQYLNPFSTDLTEISYEEKLKKYLESVLISDEMAKRVRAAFDAYIFLSYRKKDRRYANELMRMIHRNPECRDIAIWYDEFLTPGESFQDSIEKILHSSKLFALLVTPNLLEEPEGKPNFVMAQEYPAAKESGIDILPAEMVATDKAALGEKFRDIPDCVDVHDDAAFRERFLEAIQKVAKTGNDADPEHNFLIGLAYLEGIDVEVDRDRGLELVTAAAEKDLPEAMEKLYWMYHDGTGTELSYQKAAHWAEQLVEHYQKNFGEEHTDTLILLIALAAVYVQSGNFGEALTLQEKAYAIQRKVWGEENPDTLTSLNVLASIYGHLGNYGKALELTEKLYALRYKVLGEEHPDTIHSLCNLGVAYGYFGEHKKALDLQEKAYALLRSILGEEHPETISSLRSLASTCGKLGDCKESLGLNEKVYALSCKVLGEEHPNTLTSLSNLAHAYGNLGDHKKALELNEKAYALRCKILGEEHPATLVSLSNWAATCVCLGDYKKALELNKKVYTLECKILGEEHPNTLKALNNLAFIYDGLGDHKKTLELKEKVYTLRCKLLGEEHPDTLTSLNNLAVTYGELGEHKKNLELEERLYALRCKLLGEEHPDTLTSLNNLAVTYGELGEHKKEVELTEKVYALRCKVLGEEHPDTLTSLNNLAVTYYQLGEYRKAAERMEGVYSLRCAVLGADHPDTLTAQKNLSIIMKKLSRQKKSRSLNVCPRCGGALTGLFRKKCKVCGKTKAE